MNIIEQMRSLCKYEFVILELKSTQEKIKLLLGIIHKNKLQVSKDINMKGKIKYKKMQKYIFMTLVVKGLKYKC